MEKDIRIKFTEKTRYGELSDAIYYDEEPSEEQIASDIADRVEAYETAKDNEDTPTLTVEQIEKDISTLEAEILRLQSLKEEMES